MKNIFSIFILTLLFLFFKENSIAQSKSDSIKHAIQAKKDSTKQALQIRKEKLVQRQDSIATARENEKEKRDLALEEKKRIANAKMKKKVLPITQEMSIGFRLASDGWSLFSNRGFINTENDRKHTLFVWLDLAEKHHPKEVNSLNDNFSALNPNEPKPVAYKYGKINNFYQFKMGIGNQVPITGFLENKNVIINWIYGGGLSIGLLKPYYLDLFLPEGNQYIRKYSKYADDISTYFLDLNNQGTIIGGADFTKGLSEIKIKPGIMAKTGFYFEYLASKYKFLGVEIGSSFELYMQDIPIMATVKSKPYFVNIYADIRIGKRWE